MKDFSDLVDLAAERFGGSALLANDEFFAPKESLLKAAEPVWREHEYTERGKWMDGWESRRRRSPGFDWCIVRLALPGIIHGVVVDTRFFRGNFPAECSLDACAFEGVPGPEDLTGPGAGWVEVLPRSPLTGDNRNVFRVDAASRRFTHVRLNIYPDGGVARLRVHGEVVPAWPRFARQGGELDLAALENGGYVLVASDMFFGHRQNLILPGRSLFMGDGWETRRRRGPGHDWSIIRLAARGRIHRAELDTDHFKGNAPDRCMLETVDAPGGTLEELTSPACEWRPLLPETRIQPHSRHRWEDELLDAGPATHARLSVFPDGGVARLRLFGTVGPQR